MTERQPIAVLGGGSFGTAIANLLAENGQIARLWMRDAVQAETMRRERENPRYLRGIRIHDNVEPCSDLREVLAACELVFVALPSGALRQALQPVAEALRLRDALVQGRLSASGNDALTLKVEGTDHERKGKLLFSDVSVERSTGQLSMRGEFANADGMLLPGMYVRIRTPQGLDDEAILVPQRAVQRDNVGTAQVWIVDAQNRAQLRQVETGVMQGARWQIRSGLNVGDRVVVGGLNGLTADAPVAPQPFQEQQDAAR